MRRAKNLLRANCALSGYRLRSLSALVANKIQTPRPSFKFAPLIPRGVLV